MQSIAIQSPSRIKYIALLLLMSFSFLFVSQQASAEVVDQGGWVNKKYKIKGGWEIVKNGDQTIIRFDKKFKTKGGPDLKIFLSKQTIQAVTGKTATNDAIFISELASTKGSQEYVLPAGVNIDDYSSLLIHCEAYSVLWGGGAI